MRVCTVMKCFEHGNVAVTGAKGTGKDLIMGLYATYRKSPCISNQQYRDDTIPFEPLRLCINNTYKEFINGNVKYYQFPYPDGTDVLLSDGSVWFPNYACQDLNKHYESLAHFMELSRQLGLCQFHFNVQNLTRIWDKIREQADTYILCDKCYYLPFDRVLQRVTIYEKRESCESRVPPFPNVGIFSKIDKTTLELLKISYQASHGVIKRGWIFYHNKSKYDTRKYKEVLENGKKEP